MLSGSSAGEIGDICSLNPNSLMQELLLNTSVCFSSYAYNLFIPNWCTGGGVLYVGCKKSWWRSLETLSFWCSFRCLHTQLSPAWVQNSPCRLHSCKVQIPVGCWMHIRARCDPPGCMCGVILLVGNADKEFRDPTGPRISLRGIFPVTLLMLSRLEEGGWEDVWY